MSAELARRLVLTGALPSQVEAALFAAADRDVSLTRVVNELFPELIELMDRALDRADYPALHSVRPLAELVLALPTGLCERLLAVPVHRDPRRDYVDVAAVDVFDGHIASELAFQLGKGVRILRASYAELTAALSGLQQAGASLQELPIEPEWEDHAATEPVLSSLRPKPSRAASAGPPWALDFDVALRVLKNANSPEQILTGLCGGLSPVRALILAVRSGSFEVRAGSSALGAAPELRELRVPAGNGSLLDTAARLGFYLGPMAQLGALRELEGRWDVSPGSDCYARSVNVSGRPSLILLIAGFSESAEATRRADVLSKEAGDALERIVRARKKN